MITTIAHAKCVLTGEHAVLRGQPALVLPVASRFLKVTSSPQQPEQIKLVSGLPLEFESILQEFLIKAQQTLDLHTNAPWGTLSLHSTIPPGMGLGFSAAFCVAFTKILVELECIPAQDLFQTAHSLEHFFHKNSSGMDVAGVLNDHPVLYDPPHINVIKNQWKPNLHLIDSEKKSRTSDVIEAIQENKQMDPKFAQQIDENMGQSTDRALEAWNEQNTEKLAEAMEIAGNCFQKWNLIPDEHLSLMRELKLSGALAAKPTGSGNGGCILALFPPNIHPSASMPVFV